MVKARKKHNLSSSGSHPVGFRRQDFFSPQSVALKGLVSREVVGSISGDSGVGCFDKGGAFTCETVGPRNLTQ